MIGDDGADTLVDIETLLFGEQSFNLEQLSGVVDLSADQLIDLVEVYIGYFDRAPDAQGLFYWATHLVAGLGLNKIANYFATSSENQALYSESGDTEDFVNAVYDNLFGRESDESGFNFWKGKLDSGEIDEGTFTLAMIQGAQAETGGPSDAAYVQDKVQIGSYFAVTYGMNDGKDAAQVMALYDGSVESLLLAKQAVEEDYVDATDDSPEFLLQLTGVIDTPFTDLMA